MYIFTSPNRRLMLLGKKIDKELEYIVKFEPIGAVGRFSTNDEKLAEKLRTHPEFGKRFVELGFRAKEENRIIEGVRSSATQPELGKEEFDPKELIEFGKLQVKLLKSDGTFRKDASEEDINKYNQLKQKLGE